MGILWDPTGASLGAFQGNRCSLSTEFKVVGFSVEGTIMNVYGPHNAREKREFIKYLQKLRDRRSVDHWVLGGDFNLITSLEENKCG